jgi:cyclic nucleotide-binding protein/TLC ATP/ADP transporter
MLNVLAKWLNIYQDERKLLLWSVALIFLIRISSILFNNFAETAFLKRFGVEYLPLVYIINSISAFIIMGFIASIMVRVPANRLLNYLFLFCGISVGGLYFAIPLGFDLLYPILFILKTQYEVLLALIFYNLANDLFNTRQSKRLFPLLTAGGVIGSILGSFGTPFLIKVMQINVDKLLLIYLGTTLLGAIVVKRMGTRFPTLLLSDKDPKKRKSRTSIVQEFLKVIPLIKESRLVKIMIMMTLLPNVVIPIINYQFNYAIDLSFATEGLMIQFFGYFRGAMNIISLIILMFVGRLYGRWGLPVALMFHPINYMLVFIAFFLRFDLFSAMYARASTNILRTTMNAPASNILMGLYPESYRNVIRPFLRGTVVRIGVLMGAGFIMVSEGLVHPRHLSLVAMIFVAGWIITTIFLKRGYSKILLDLISRNMLDLKSLEDKDVGDIFNDKNVQNQLVQAFLSARGNNCLWYARLLKSLGVRGLDSHILSTLKNQENKTKIELLSMLSPQAGDEAIRVFKELAEPGREDLMAALVKAASRFDSELSSDFEMEVFKTTKYPEVKAYAVTGLYQQDPEKYRGIINTWLDEDDITERKAGVIVAGESGEDTYISRLEKMLGAEKNDPILPFVLAGLHRLGAPGMNTLAHTYLSHSMESVRMAALEAFEIEDDDDLRTVIDLLNDPSNRVHEKAKHRLESSSYQNAQLLVESLTIPRRRVRDGLFYLLESMDVKNLDVFRAARFQIERSYRNMAEAETLRLLPESRERELLLDHLEQKSKVRLENALRVLAIQDRSGQMRTIWRGISSVDLRRRSNSLEALDDLLDPSLSGLMMPLLEDLPPSQCLAVGRKKFKLPNFDSDPVAIYPHLLAKKNWATVVLTLYLASKQGVDEAVKDVVENLTGSENVYICQMAQCGFFEKQDRPIKKEDGMGTEISVPDKILHLRRIQIFEELSITELAAVASVTEDSIFQPGETVIKEGDPGEIMYLIIEGEVSVNKNQEQGHEIELDRISAGDYFGEMALFEDMPRSATIRTLKETHLLMLHKQEFAEIVREYPQIALNICRVLGARLRKSHDVVKCNER